MWGFRLVKCGNYGVLCFVKWGVGLVISPVYNLGI